MLVFFLWITDDGIIVDYTMLTDLDVIAVSILFFLVIISGLFITILYYLGYYNPKYWPFNKGMNSGWF